MSSPRAPACGTHLTADERADLEQAQPPAPSPSSPDPACWTWPVPTSGTPAERFDAMHGDPERCAACGHVGRLVSDHDHQTGMVRGLLCRSCNGREPGALPGSTLAKYRDRNPASMTGLIERYWSPFPATTQLYAHDDESLSRAPALALDGLFT